MLQRFFRIAGSIPGIAVIAAVCAACPGDQPADSFGIRLSLDDSAQGATCVNSANSAPSCADYPLFCRVLVGIRVVAITSDESSPTVFASACVAAGDSPNATLCDLAGLDLSIANDEVPLPRELLRLEVAVWDGSELGDSPTCPFDGVDFDLAGRPKPETSTPLPAFGRRIDFDFNGENETPVVALACINPNELAKGSCLPATAAATIFDIDTLAPVPEEEVKDVSIAIGQPVEQPGGFVIEDTNTIPLAKSPNPGELVPVFQATLPERFAPGEDVCLLVTESDFFKTTAVTCTQAPEGDIKADAFLLRKSILDALLAADDISTPPEGLVIGRVVDQVSRAPVAGAVVSPSDQNTLISYINADLTDTNVREETSASGYFLARSVAFATTWAAAAPGGLVSVTPPPRAGIVRDRATILIIEMVPEPQPLGVDPGDQRPR